MAADLMDRAVICMSVLVGLCAGVGVLGGQLYAAGGHDGPLVRKSVEVFDPHTNGWRLVCDMNMCRRNAGYPPHKVYYFLFTIFHIIS